MTCCNQILHAATITTPCECQAAGYCKRHKCDKPAHLYNLCRTSLVYYESYEKGEGPLQNVSSSPQYAMAIGFGDIVAGAIKVVTFGRVKMCAACQSRRAKLNGWLRIKIPTAERIKGFISKAWKNKNAAP